MIKYELIRFPDGRQFMNFWAPAFHGGRDLTYRELKSTLVQFRDFEDWLRFYPDITGWITWVKYKYPKVHSLVRKLGGQLYQKDHDRAWYVRRLTVES